jgi:multifunctional cyclase/dehydratase/O-methyltransferase
MTQLGRWETDRHLDAVVPERHRRIVDLGGGRGHFLAAALRRAPEATGVLVERAEVLARADDVLTGEGVAGRVETRAADLFADPLPAGADAYVLKAVLHNWGDDRARELLRRVRAAIGDGPGALYVVEQVIAPGNAFDHAKFLDVDMLVLFGGRERTLEQWRELLGSAGFALVGDPGHGRWTVLHAEPV